MHALYSHKLYHGPNPPSCTLYALTLRETGPLMQILSVLLAMRIEEAQGQVASKHQSWGSYSRKKAKKDILNLSWAGKKRSFLMPGK